MPASPSSSSPWSRSSSPSSRRAARTTRRTRPATRSRGLHGRHDRRDHARRHDDDRDDDHAGPRARDPGGHASSTPSRRAASRRLQFSKGDTIRFRVSPTPPTRSTSTATTCTRTSPAGGSVTFTIPGQDRRPLRGRAGGQRHPDRGARGPACDRAGARRALGLAAAARRRWRCPPPRRPTASSASRTCRSRAGCSPGAPRSCSSPRSSGSRSCGRRRGCSTSPSAVASACRASLEVLAGALGVAAFVLVVYAGFAGHAGARPRTSCRPSSTWSSGSASRSCRSCSATSSARSTRGWRVGEASGWVERRARRRRRARAAALPGAARPLARGGRVLAFAWVELVYANSDDPSQLAIMALAYAAVQLVGMSLYGVEHVVASRRRVRRLLRDVRAASRRCTGATARCTRARRWPARRR